MSVRREPDEAFSRLVMFGGMYCWIAPVLVAAFARSQVFAAVLGIGGLAGLALAATRLPGVGGVDDLLREDPWMAGATAMVAVSPLLLLGYAVTGSVLTLGAMIVAGTAALLIRYVVRGDFEWNED